MREESLVMSARTDTEATQTQAATGITPEILKSTLTHKLEAVHVDIEDLSGAPEFPRSHSRPAMSGL